MRFLLALALLLPFATAQTATVNDPLSPGTLADSLLSLDEAIRLVNGSLSLAQLSSAELGQVSGGVQPTQIQVNAINTPTITLQAVLTPLEGPAPGVDVMIMGVMGRPRIDAGTLPLALHVRSNTAMVTDLVIANGQVGVRVDGFVNFTATRTVMLDRCELVGQTAVGLDLAATGVGALTPVTVRDCLIRSQNIGVRIDDRSTSGQVVFVADYVEWNEVQLAVDLFCGATGNLTMCRMFRCSMTSGVQLLKVRRGATNDQRIMVMMIGGDFTCSGDAIDALGTAVIESAVHIHHSIIRPGVGRKAFVIGPQDARIDFHLSENIVYGDLDVQEGRLNRRLWAWNNIFRDGTLTISNLGTPTSFRWNRFENHAVVAAPTNQARLLMTSSEFENCNLDGQAALGGIELENCWTHATARLGNVSISTPAPSRWLGQGWASTETPHVGSHVDLTLDIPDGMVGAWQFGFTDPLVVLTNEPWRFYAAQSFTVMLPGLSIFQTTVRLPIPTDPHLVGLELYCAPLTAPYRGQMHVPPVNLPRGVYLRIAP